MKRITYFIITASVLFTSACSSSDTTPTPPSTAPVSSNQAQSVATALYAGATPVNVELTTNNGRRVWDVELDNGLAVYVDVNTGDVIEVERIGSNDDSDDIDAPGDTSTSISVVEAQRIATNLYPGTTVIDTDLEFNYGRRVWDVELSNGIAVYVDVTTGDIVEIEGDNDMDDDLDDDDDSGNGSSDTTITAAEAANIALTRFPGATVIDTDLGTENGRQVWYVDLNNGFEVYVDAITGAIISVENDTSDSDDDFDDDDDDFDDDDSGNGSGSAITASEAANIALTRFPGATVIDTDLGTENGRQVWYVDLSNGFEVYVDAATGAIISVENDGSDSDDDFDDDTDFGSDGGNGSGSVISATEAANIALTRFPSATVIDTWLGTENGRQVWYVDLNNGVEVYVDATTGNTIAVENDGNDSDDDFDDDTDDDDDFGSDGGNSSGSTISASQAASIALTRFPNATVIDTDLGNEDGRQVWYVDLSGGIEVYVDAITGAILTVERD
jgi:uncharacterized membrane protein YkoI